MLIFCSFFHHCPPLRNEHAIAYCGCLYWILILYCVSQYVRPELAMRSLLWSWGKSSVRPVTDSSLTPSHMPLHRHSHHPAEESSDTNTQLEYSSPISWHPAPTNIVRSEASDSSPAVCEALSAGMKADGIEDHRAP